MLCLCAALYACPYCEGSYHDWQVPLYERGHFKPRTLDSLAENLKDFKSDGARSDRSKLVSKSVVREALLPIEPADVSTC